MKNKGPARKGENRSCLSCGSVFYVKPSWVKLEGRGKYCSNNCQHAYMKAHGIKPKAPLRKERKERKEKPCDICGEGVAKIGKKYCSDQCKESARILKYDFSYCRKKAKENGITQFKYDKPCIKCAKRDQIYYVAVVSQKCKTCHNEDCLQYRISDQNKQKYKLYLKNYSSKYRKENKIKITEYHRKYRKDNPELVKKLREKTRKNPKNKIIINIRKRLSKVLKSIKVNNKNYSKTIGCAKEHLIAQLESKFTPKMTWENYGSYWHVDHIIPISSFDLTDPEQCKQANHWTNLQPLEASANLAKSNKLIQPQMSLMLNL